MSLTYGYGIPAAVEFRKFNSMNEGRVKVGVVGLGVMGFDIAFLYAMRGYPTMVYDVSKSAMETVPERREQTIERLKRRNRISDDETESVRKLLIPSSDLEELAQVDLVTEAVSENAIAKSAVYQVLKKAAFTGILTTNTSSLTHGTLLSGGVYDSAKFASTHFFNPVLYTQMVEVVSGTMGKSNYDAVFSFLKSLGRAPIETKDICGFVSNSILMVYAVMALRLLECGARIDEIDLAAKEMRLLPPFISFDSWKPSIVEDVTRIMFDLRGDHFLRSSELLCILAKDNPKFYIDQKPNPAIYQKTAANARQIPDESIKRALKVSILVSAARVVELGESPATVDCIATEGLKIPEPPLKEIDGVGAEAVLADLAKINQALANHPLSAPRLLTAMVNHGERFYHDGRPNPWLFSHLEQPISHASH